MELVKQQQCQVLFTAAEMESVSGAAKLEICESVMSESTGTAGDLTDWVTEQFLNGTSAQSTHKLFSAMPLKVELSMILWVTVS